MAYPQLNEFVKMGKKVIGAGINYRLIKFKICID